MRALLTKLETIRSGITDGEVLLSADEVELELSYQRYRAAEQIVRDRIGYEDERLQRRLDCLIGCLCERNDLRLVAEEFLRMASFGDAELQAALESSLV